MTSTSGETDLSTISNEEIEVQNLVERGEIDKAISIYQNLKPKSARTFHLLGSLFNEKKGDYPSAIHCFQQALRIEEENGDDTGDTLTKLGSTYQNLREYDFALLYHSRALNLRESSQNIDQRSIAINLLGLANVYWGQQNLSEALIYAQRALTLNRSVPSDNNPYIATNLAVLANIYHHSGDDTYALLFAKQALTLLEHSPASDSSLLVALLNNIGTIQATAGLFDDARLTFIRLLHIYEEILPKGHRKRVIIENNIKNITRIQGRNPMILFSRFSNILTKFLL